MWGEGHCMDAVCRTDPMNPQCMRNSMGCLDPGICVPNIQTAHGPQVIPCYAASCHRPGGAVRKSIGQEEGKKKLEGRAHPTARFATSSPQLQSSLIVTTR
eukprot:gene14867-biopygen23140